MLATCTLGYLIKYHLEFSDKIYQFKFEFK